MLEKASGQDLLPETPYSKEVRCMKLENEKLLAPFPRKFCERCRKQGCDGGSDCPAMGQQCSNCLNFNHFARVCRSLATKAKKKKAKEGVKLETIQCGRESQETVRGIFQHIIIGKLGKEGIATTVLINRPKTT